MEKKNEKTPLECLEEEVRVFRKNEEATYDMLALYELLVKDDNVHSLIGITLVEKLIRDLEDTEVKILTVADSVHDVLRDLDKQFYAILNKYKNIEECKEYCDDFNTSYKEMFASRDMSRLFYRSETPKFNLIKNLLYCSSQFVYKFLVSEISFNTRLEMFAYVLGSYDQSEFYYFLQGPNRNYLSKEEYQKAPSKMKEILDAFNRNKCKICKVQDLTDHLLKDSQYGYMGQLHEFGIDFNSCYYKYSSKSEPDLDGKLISTVGVLFDRKPFLSFIEDLYEEDSYLNVNKVARNNNDLLILSSIARSEIPRFISLSHFEVTAEKVRFLASRIMEAYKDYSIDFLNSAKETFKIENKVIADAIIRKSKNKEEYKKMSQYANLFMELTDMDKEITRREEEKKAQIERQELLEQKRQEFTTLLYNMNEYAQENIPPRTLVKNIKFGE